MTVSCCWLGMAETVVAQTGGLQSPELGYPEPSAVRHRLTDRGAELPQPVAMGSEFPQPKLQPLPAAAAPLIPLTNPNQTALQQPMQFAGAHRPPQQAATRAWRSAEIGEAPLALPSGYISTSGAAAQLTLPSLDGPAPTQSPTFQRPLTLPAMVADGGRPVAPSVAARTPPIMPAPVALSQPNFTQPLAIPLATQPVQPAPIATIQPTPIPQPPIAQQMAPRPKPIVAAPVVAAPVATAPIVAAPVVGAPVTPLPQLAVRPESTKSFLPLVTLPSVVAASPAAAPPVAKEQVAKQPATAPVEPHTSAPMVTAQPALQLPARVPQEVRAPMYVAAIEPALAAPVTESTESTATNTAPTAQSSAATKPADEQAGAQQVATTPPVQKETAEKLPSIPPAPSILGAIPPAPSLLGSTIETPLELRDAIVMALSQNKEIRVIQQTPQAVANDVTIANAYFDTKFGVGVYGGQDFRQLADQLQSFGAVINENRYDYLLNPERINNIYLAKELHTGGSVEIGVGTIYERYDQFGAFRTVNPAWNSGLNLHAEQPLGAGRGRAIADLPIQIAYTNYVSQSFAVQGQINRVIRDVELAYWVTVLQELRLRRILSSVERAARLVQAEDKRLDLGDGTLPDVLGAKEQLFRFQQLAQEATLQAVTARVELNRLLGAPLDSQAYFTPVTEPDFSEPQLEWETACVRAIGRPEVRAQTAAYRTATLLLAKANNELLPNVRAEADYRAQGLEDRLDSSFDTAGNFEYYRWGAGVFYETPIGRRAAHAGANKAKWIVSQQRARIDEVRQTIFAELASAYQQVALSYQNLSISRQRTAAANERVVGLVKLQENGKVNIDTILFAELRSIEADLAEADAMLVYERARVLWEYAQGRLLERWTLFVEPGACPPGFTDTELQGQESQDAQLATYAALTPSETAKPLDAAPAKVEEVAALPADEFRLLPTVQ